MSPIANHFFLSQSDDAYDKYFPLHPKTCDECGFVQLPVISSREELFPSDYAYYSSYSASWLAHSEEYANSMVGRLRLTEDDLVVEIASNDGYLLQYFQNRGIKVLGVEPAAQVAQVAENERGITTVVDFFGDDCGKRLSSSGYKPRLMVANNVLAHVPDIHDFISGFESLLRDDGIITFEFPHLYNLITHNQFDTIYHEHYSYLSVTALTPIFLSHAMRIFDIEKLTTHGGSLRIYVCKVGADQDEKSSVQEVLTMERESDPRDKKVISKLQDKSQKVKFALMAELATNKLKGIRIAAYGAAAKGNTLLNFAGIDVDLIDYVVDLNPRKQGMLLPGSRIPVVGLDHLEANPPDILLILPWNLSDEIAGQLSDLRRKGVRFLRAIPKVEYF
jgi:SAM-dependent methyltransferase